MASRLTYRTVNLSSATAACKTGPQDVRTNGKFSHLPSQHLHRVISTSLTFAYTAHTKIVARVKESGLLFDLNKA